MDRINQIIERVIAKEGGYVNNPADRGGETMYGITVAAARREKYFGPMKEMPISLAWSIYQKRYIENPGFNHLIPIDIDIAEEVIDTGVNMGPAVSAMFLQRWLNGLNSQGLYEDLFVDGRIGPASVNALREFLKWRRSDGKKVLIRGLNGAQANRYLEIAEARPSQRQFLFGWVLQRVVSEI